MKIVVVIQARLTSTRFPNKVMQTVGGKTLVKRLWDAAKGSFADQVVVAWPEGFPELDENDVLGRFQKIALRTGATHIVRLTADCPLITSQIINEAIRTLLKSNLTYYCNRGNYSDGFDVQVMRTEHLWNPLKTDREHVIKSEGWPTEPKYSVDTKEDLERVRQYAR
jgi:glutamate-1-semialdehyde 2,1-aminomutase